jgi:hypothetical protein
MKDWMHPKTSEELARNRGIAYDLEGKEVLREYGRLTSADPSVTQNLPQKVDLNRMSSLQDASGHRDILGLLRESRENLSLKARRAPKEKATNKKKTRIIPGETERVKGRRSISSEPITKTDLIEIKEEYERKESFIREGKNFEPRHLLDTPKPKPCIKRQGSLPAYSQAHPSPISPPPDFPQYTTAMVKAIERASSWTSRNWEEATRAWHKHGNASLSVVGRGGWPEASEVERDRAGEVRALVDAVHNASRHEFVHCGNSTEKNWGFCRVSRLPSGRGLRYNKNGLVGFLNDYRDEKQLSLPGGSHGRKLQRKGHEND